MLLAGTVSSSLVALAIAIPLGTIIAIYCPNLPATASGGAQAGAGTAVRHPTSSTASSAAGHPPILQKIYPGLPTFNILSAGIVMGIMIIPYVSSLSEDAMRSSR